MTDLLLNLLIFAGFVSGIALFIGLVHAKYRHENEAGGHDSNTCTECMTGFLCAKVVKTKESVRG